MATEKRKKVTVAVVLGTAALISLIAIVFGKIYASEAEKNAMEAQAQTELALEQKQRADLLQQKAEEAAAEARMTVAEAARVMEQLEACRSK